MREPSLEKPAFIWPAALPQPIISAGIEARLAINFITTQQRTGSLRCLKVFQFVSRLDLIDDWPGLARKSGYDAAELARMCGISASQLRRYFSDVFRRPPQEWINELRMWDAMQLLAQGHAVTKVAVALNFSNIAHLSQRYKEYHGHPPSELKSYLKGKKRELLLDHQEEITPWRDAELRLLSPLHRKRH